MKTKKSSFFYCLLSISLVLLTGCASTKMDNLQVEKKTTTSAKTKKTLPPQVIQVIQGPDRLRVIAYSDVCFRKNGQLTNNCSKQLTQVMKTIKSYGDGLIQVVGYTDDLYDPQTAAKIAQKQADTMTSFLWLHGIGSQRLRTVGYGAHDFIASNRSVRASSLNRRVEIILIKN